MNRHNDEWSVYSRNRGEVNKETIINEAHNFLIKSCFKEYKAESGTFISKDRDYKYRLGVIDFLTQYNAAKRIETTWNTIKHWHNAHTTSC